MTRYRPSTKSYDPLPALPQYDASMCVRKADCNGRLCFKNSAVKIGKAFIRETLGIREEKDDGLYSLWWYSTKVGMIDFNQRAAYVGKSF